MLYLAIQHGWWLAGALAIGVVMGAIGRGGEPLRPLPSGFVAAALLWGVGAAAVWSRTLNGDVALHVETALLYTAVYAAGCMLGSLSRAAAGAAGEAVPALAAVGVSAPVHAAEPAGMSFAGRRPPGLAAADAGPPDDLKLLSGVAEQNERRLNALGIWRFEQIAAWNAEEIAWVSEYLAFPGRIAREDWVGQARILAAGGDTEHSRALKGGRS